MINGLLQDFRYALRQLRKSPGFAAVAMLILALGIGANTAIYSLLDQVLLRSLPVKNPGSLVMLESSGSDRGHVNSWGGDNHLYFSYPMYRDLRDRNAVFDGLLARAPAQVGVQFRNESKLAMAELVSGNYFAVLGVRPAAGRLLSQRDDEVLERDPVAVLSYDYWAERFGYDPAVINSSVLVNGHPYTIVGVAQPGFKSVVVGDNPGLFVPMMMKPQITPGWNDLADHRSRWLNIIARLKPGGNLGRAEAGIEPLWKALRHDELKDIHNQSADWADRFVNKSRITLLDAKRGFSPLRDQIQTPLLIVMGMVVLVMVIACANLATLLLVRAAGRKREMAVRYSLGAKRSRIVQQLLMEGMLLGVGGGLLGLLLAPQITAFLLRRMFSDPAGNPFKAHLDLRIFAFNLAVGIAAGLVFSVVPALEFWRPNLTPALKQQNSTWSARQSLTKQVFVGVQIALSVLLLFGAGLFVRTMKNLRSVDVGFRPDHLLTFSIDPTLAGYDKGQATGLTRRLLDTLGAIPGVRAVAATDDPELSGNDVGTNVTIAGLPSSAQDDTDVERAQVTPTYFATMDMPLLAGRTLTEQDNRPDAARVAVVNEAFAKRWFESPQKAIGRYYGIGGGPNTKTDIEIVGVVRNVKHSDVRTAPKPTGYLAVDRDLDRKNFGMAYYLRTWALPAALMITVRSAVQQIDPKLAMDGFRGMDEQIDQQLSTERLVTFLATSFGVLATLLCAVGLYGVLAFSATQRTREIGIRMALGADRASVLRMMFGEVGRLLLISFAIAIPAALACGRLIRNQLFGVSNYDPLTLLAVTCIIAATALAASFLPVRRAAAVEPMQALRYE
ncbi:MAG TPA: ABC transporter permease [Candidatus Angelobacter sp.]|nr:ABC transporter permease [Candidatus Angelobacter sp.]